MSKQWAVVFFDNDFDQQINDGVGPFRSRERAISARKALGAALQGAAAPQVVALHSLRDAIDVFAVAPEPHDPN